MQQSEALFEVYKLTITLNPYSRAHDNEISCLLVYININVSSFVLCSTIDHFSFVRRRKPPLGKSFALRKRSHDESSYAMGRRVKSWSRVLLLLLVAVHLDVTTQFDLPQEWPRTHVAVERLGSGVLSSVCDEVRRLTERLTTVMANIWLFTWTYIWT